MKNKNLTKEDISLAVYEKIGINKKFCSEMVNDLFENIKGSLLKGQGVKVHGFGKFALKDTKERKGRNPQTGKAMTIKSRRVVSFQASPYFKNQF